MFARTYPHFTLFCLTAKMRSLNKYAVHSLPAWPHQPKQCGAAPHRRRTMAPRSLSLSKSDVGALPFKVGCRSRRVHYSGFSEPSTASVQVREGSLNRGGARPSRRATPPARWAGRRGRQAQSCAARRAPAAAAAAAPCAVWRAPAKECAATELAGAARGRRGGDFVHSAARVAGNTGSSVWRRRCRGAGRSIPQPVGAAAHPGVVGQELFEAGGGREERRAGGLRCMCAKRRRKCRLPTTVHQAAAAAAASRIAQQQRHTCVSPMAAMATSWSRMKRCATALTVSASTCRRAQTGRCVEIN